LRKYTSNFREGSSVAVKKLNLSNLGKQPGVSMPFGKFSQSYKWSSLRFCKLEMLLGSSLRFLQHMLNVRDPCSSDEGSADLSVPCWISGNFSRLSQP
jgi:hypothetical protein